MEHMAEDYATGIARAQNISTNETTESTVGENDENVSKVSDNIFANISKFKHEEYQYLNLIQNILENGVWEEGRNGKTKSIFGHTMRFSLKDGKIPI